MKKVKDFPVTEEMLAKFEIGQNIDRYCFYTNITFQGVEDDKVILMDSQGRYKKDPKWLFFRHARMLEK